MDNEEKKSYDTWDKINLLLVGRPMDHILDFGLTMIIGCFNRIDDIDLKKMYLKSFIDKLSQRIGV